MPILPFSLTLTSYKATPLQEDKSELEIVTSDVAQNHVEHQYHLKIEIPSIRKS